MTQLPEAVADTALDMALVHGLLQRSHVGALTHCPLMLSPTPLVDSLHTELGSLTTPFSLLAHRVANNLEFLAEQLHLAAAADDYTRFLLALALEEERREQFFRFLITRSDYFVTQTGDQSAAALRQVELNTIAASYVGLAGRIADFHRTWRSVRNKDWDLIPNDPVSGVADAFAEAMAAYGVPTAFVLFVVQPGERNVFDQRILEMALAERGIGVIRASLEAIGERGRLRDGELVFDGRIIAITYFRAGYHPNELQSEPARQARRLISRSATISVPDLASHLAGTKKIQQVLTAPERLRMFLDEEDASRVERSFARIVTLDEIIDFDGRQLPAIEAATTEPNRFVLKPQREGGGFNVYGEDIPHQLRHMNPDERHTYVLMERLYPPVHQAFGLRGGCTWQGDVVSEIGCFGVFFATNDTVRFNRGVGYLVRTKLNDTNEGGISAGYGHLDSLARVAG